jgi:hypothetical protein
MIICRADFTNLSLEIVILLTLLLRAYFLAAIEFIKNRRQAPQATNSIDLALLEWCNYRFGIIICDSMANAATKTLKKQLELCIYGRFFLNCKKLETKHRQAKSTSQSLVWKPFFDLDAFGMLSLYKVTAYKCRAEHILSNQLCIS